MGYIISFGYSQSAIWFYNLRAPQICFRNFWDQKIDQVETQDRCVQSIILNFRKFFLVEGSQKSWRENLDWSAKFLKTMIWVFGIMYLHHHPKCVWVVAWLPLETKIFKNISSFQVSFDWFFLPKTSILVFMANSAVYCLVFYQNGLFSKFTLIVKHTIAH